MNVFLLDTDCAVELINGRLLSLPEDTDAAVSSVTAYELWVGALACRSQRTREETLSFLQAVPIIEFGGEAARESARVRRELERTGNGIGPYDTLIAGHCRSLGRTLATGNVKEFKRVRGLRLWDFRNPS